jgi:hypothetical protein
MEASPDVKEEEPAMFLWIGSWLRSDDHEENQRRGSIGGNSRTISVRCLCVIYRRSITPRITTYNNRICLAKDSA